MTRITPCLWFDFNAEEAVAFYLSVFPDGRVLEVQRYGDTMPALAGKVMTMVFEVAGMRLLALNGGPQFHFTEAISLAIECADQDEVDRLWAGLTAGGGKPSQCGWLKDRFGLSWQVLPRRLLELMRHPDPAVVARAFQAMLPMQKLDIAAVERAASG